MRDAQYRIKLRNPFLYGIKHPAISIAELRRLEAKILNANCAQDQYMRDFSIETLPDQKNTFRILIRPSF